MTRFSRCMPVAMTMCEIQQHLTEIYGAEVSPTFISTVTDGVLDEVKHRWQPGLSMRLSCNTYLDCIHAKDRDTGSVRAKAIYLRIGINMEGHKEILGLWIAQTEGRQILAQRCH